MSVYGHRQLTFFFFPLLETLEDGFIFKRKRYAWQAIEHVEIWQEIWPPFGPVAVEYVASGQITLTDGNVIKINGRAFEKKDESLEKGYRSAFDEIISQFRKQASSNNQFKTIPNTHA